MLILTLTQNVSAILVYYLEVFYLNCYKYAQQLLCPGYVVTLFRVLPNSCNICYIMATGYNILCANKEQPCLKPLPVTAM